MNIYQVGFAELHGTLEKYRSIINIGNGIVMLELK